LSLHFIMDLIHLPDFELDSMKKRSIGWVAVLKPKERWFLCPVCRGSATSHKRKKNRLLRHRFIPHFGFIYVEVPVYHEQCTACLAVWSVQWEGIPQRGKVTDMFKETIVSLCQETTIQSAAKAVDIPYTTLERWYYAWADRENGRNIRERKAPKILSLDDFSIQKVINTP
jgi:transposase